jgi:hypothetical protein
LTVGDCQEPAAVTGFDPTFPFVPRFNAFYHHRVPPAISLGNNGFGSSTIAFPFGEWTSSGGEGQGVYSESPFRLLKGAHDPSMVWDAKRRAVHYVGVCMRVEPNGMPQNAPPLICGASSVDGGRSFPNAQNPFHPVLEEGETVLDFPQIDVNNDPSSPYYGAIYLAARDTSSITQTGAKLYRCMTDDCLTGLGNFEQIFPAGGPKIESNLTVKVGAGGAVYVAYAQGYRIDATTGLPQDTTWTIQKLDADGQPVSGVSPQTVPAMPPGIPADDGRLVECPCRDVHLLPRPVGSRELWWDRSTRAGLQLHPGGLDAEAGL